MALVITCGSCTFSPMGSLDEPLGEAIELKARQRSYVDVLSLGDGNFDAMFFEEGLEWTGTGLELSNFFESFES